MALRRQLQLWIPSLLLGAALLCTVFPSTYPGPIGALAFLGLAPLIPSSRRIAALPPITLFLLAACGLCLLQLLPVPGGLVEWLSPHAAETGRQTAVALGEQPPGWLQLSIDPRSTAGELALLLGYAALSLVLARSASLEKGRRRLLETLVVVGAGIGLLAVAHHALNADSFLGLIELEDREQRFPSPLGNVNRLATLVAVIASVSVVLAIEANDPRRRAAWAAITLFCFGLCLYVKSRGGTLALSAGIITSAALWWRGRLGVSGHRRQKRLARYIPVAILVGCAGIVAVSVAWDQLSQEFTARAFTNEFDNPKARLSLWAANRDLLELFKWTGAGGGTYDSAVPLVASARVSHAENDYLEAAVYYGLPGVILLGGLFVWALWRALGHIGDRPLLAGAAGGLVVLLMQAAVESTGRYPGLAGAGLALLAVLEPAVPRRVKSDGRARWRIGRAAAVAVGLLCVLALGWYDSPVRRDRARLNLAAVASAGAPLATARFAEELMERHPADFYAPMVAAEAYYQAGQTERALMLLEVAVARYPQSGITHHLHGRILLELNRREEACEAFARASVTTTAVRLLTEEIVGAFGDGAPAALCISDTPRMEILRELQNRRHRNTALHVARRMSAHQAAGSDVLLALGRLELAIGEPTTAHMVARLLERRAPGFDSALLRAQYHQRMKQNREAEEALLTAASRANSRRESVRALVALARLRMNDTRHDDARTALRRAMGIAGHDPALRRLVHMQLAALERAQGNTHRAKWELERARELSP